MSASARASGPNGSTADGSIRRARWTLVAAALLSLLVVAGGALYAAGGGASRHDFVSELMISVILVVGLQVFVGNTGVLSFGHLGFASLAAYGTALLAIPVAAKANVIPDAPWGISRHALNPLAAAAVGLGVVLLVGGVLAVVLGRTSGLAATMISLSFLFMVEQVAKNWTQLTHGAGNLGSIPRLHGNGAVVLAMFVTLVVAGAFRDHRLGRFAEATREDELAARAIGIDPFGPRAAALLLSALIVGLGGVLRVRQLGSIGPSQFAFTPTIAILAMLVVGGMRSVTGAVAGTVLVSSGKELARFLGDGPRWLGFRWPRVEGLPDLFLAACLLLVMLLRPGGLLDGFELSRWLARRSDANRPSPAAEPAGGALTTLNTPADAGGAALVVRALCVDFGGFSAVREVSFTVRPGTVHGLIGPNGAGKSTVVNALTGLVEARGSAVLDGVELLGRGPVGVARAGVARTFQNLRVFRQLSVDENVELAHLAGAAVEARRTSLVGTAALLDASGLAHVADRAAGALDYGTQRRMEIARAAALGPSVLLLDEPTSGMSDTESFAMVDHVRGLARAIGASVLVIDHDLAFVTGICDEITVLDQGAVLAHGTPSEIAADPAVRAAYLGEG